MSFVKCNYFKVYATKVSDYDTRTIGAVVRFFELSTRLSFYMYWFNFAVVWSTPRQVKNGEMWNQK